MTPVARHQPSLMMNRLERAIRRATRIERYLKSGRLIIR
jgi:hypothetical protein